MEKIRSCCIGRKKENKHTGLQKISAAGDKKVGNHLQSSVSGRLPSLTHPCYGAVCSRVGKTRQFQLQDNVLNGVRRHTHLRAHTHTHSLCCVSLAGSFWK